MKKRLFVAKYIALLFIILLVTGFLFPAWTPSDKGKDSIYDLRQVKINGTGLEIMIRGRDKSNPVLLFVHGGPGCSEIPYVRKYQKQLEENFTIVHYDQRGSGKSYHFFEDYTDLSKDLLIEDLQAVTEYILERLNKDKVLLAGHSYGTYIAAQAAARTPDKYQAYIGLGQIGNLEQSESEAFEFCMKEARKAGNKKDINNLNRIKQKVLSNEILMPRKYVRKYGGTVRLIDDNRDYFMGFLFSPEYKFTDILRYYSGIFRFQEQLLKETILKPLPQIVESMEIPCYIIMGKYDYMTTKNAAKDYFDYLQAPEKEFIIYDKSAHYPQFEEKEKFSEWMKEIFYERF